MRHFLITQTKEKRRGGGGFSLDLKIHEVVEPGIVSHILDFQVNTSSNKGILSEAMNTLADNWIIEPTDYTSGYYYDRDKTDGLVISNLTNWPN